ncbi:MAG TPA: YciI family protein [Polyangiaceae bacterium]|nr:YciI family protein [Polyangiaceae bacterium]
MSSYALLIYRASLAAVPKGDERKALAGHRALQVEAARAGDLHAVARLEAPSTARSVKARVGGHDVTDGPLIESKEWLVGFYLLDCADEAEAIARAQQICTDPWHVIEVRPVDWRWRP